MSASPRIKPAAWVAATAFQRVYPLMMRRRNALRMASRPIAPPTTVTVPTRHGRVDCLVYRPHPLAPLAKDPKRRPPVHVEIHGGAFITRFPEQDSHIADYIASEVGAVVISVDHDTAPQVRYPVAEEQCFDVVKWVHRAGVDLGWDSERISIGGVSSGGKLAINVCQQAYRQGGPEIKAVVPFCALADVTRADRTSPHRRPRVPRALQRLVMDTYFIDPATRHEPLASPGHDPDLAVAMPPALIITAAYDTLGPEMDELADRLTAAGVEVTHRRFPTADHGFTHFGPVEVAREAFTLMAKHLLTHLA